MDKHSVTYQPLQALCVKAAADLPACRFVGYNGNLCAEGAKALGVAEVDWLSGELASVVSLGTIAIETATSVNLGDAVTSDSLGRAIPAETGKSVNGRALKTLSGAGFIKIMLVP